MISALRERPARVMVAVLAIALVYWLWFGMTQRSMISDDGISFLAAQSILDEGVMRLPSGFPYHRGYIPHYMLAGSIFAFGVNDFAVMLPSLLMALGSLWLVYVFARDVLGRPWIGVLAAGLLMLFEIETFYATSPRMYMGLQFFTMLAAYSAWRGYIQGSAGFKVVAFLALAGAALSSKMGIGIVVAVPAAVVAVALLRGAPRPRLSVIGVGGLLVVAASVIFVGLFEPDGRIHDSVTLAGREPDRLGLNLNPTVWGRYFIGSERALPYKDKALYVGSALALVAFLFTARRRLGSAHGLIYSLAMVGAYGLLLLFLVKHTAARYWFDVLPIYLLVVSVAGVALVRSYGASLLRWATGQNLALRLSAPLMLVALPVVYFALGAPDFDLVRKAAGPPCWGQGWRCDKIIEQHYDFLRPFIDDDDMIVATNPWITNYYLGRVDAFLREKVLEGGEFTTWDFPTDDYFGVPLIDSPEELIELYRGERRVWIVTDPKIEWAASEETREILESMFATYHQDEITTTYVNCAQAACGAIAHREVGR